MYGVHWFASISVMAGRNDHNMQYGHIEIHTNMPMFELGVAYITHSNRSSDS